MERIAWSLSRLRDKLIEARDKLDDAIKKTDMLIISLAREIAREQGFDSIESVALLASIKGRVYSDDVSAMLEVSRPIAIGYMERAAMAYGLPIYRLPVAGRRIVLEWLEK